jgi:hypothetical protein
LSEQPTRMTYKEWEAEGERRFGKDKMLWKFVCPICKHVQSVRDYAQAGASSDVVGFSCVGRWIKGSREAFQSKPGKQKKEGPCNYAGGGLFAMNPITVVKENGKETQAFAFAEPDPKPEPKETPPCPTSS